MATAEGGSALEQLSAMLGEPTCWGWARPAVWEASERHLGRRLPVDYKAFLDLYGSGTVDGYLTIDRPADDSGSAMESHWGPAPALPSWYADIADEPWDFQESDVDAGALLMWGGDEEGGRYFFLAVEEDPSQWRIVVNSEAGEWFETAGTFTEFLLRCFRRVDRPAFMHGGWPGPGARHEPLA
ncbi:SMI1/KNR4 family protein [Kitasatospora sp. NPDC088346]|uniref:SMI1/KNR4 family protein n=1 Tax=Kitasatospora sp. NPDC088346 TaxID=3364073 RepID=UPI00380364CC